MLGISPTMTEKARKPLPFSHGVGFREGAWNLSSQQAAQKLS